MYPFFRMFVNSAIAHRLPKLHWRGVHHSTHVCLPWDIDPWRELNNGRTLTLYDLARIPFAQRTGMTTMLRREGWGMAVAGASVRYRQRVRMFATLRVRSRLLGWDARFLYLEQSMWLKTGACASHALFRSAVTDRNGIVTTDRVMQALDIDEASPALPRWAQAWVDAEAQRDWPPMQDAAPSAP